MKVLLTGSSGFIGSRLLESLTGMRDYELSCMARMPVKYNEGVKVFISDLASVTDWSEVLAGQQVIIHAAARAHVLKDTAADPLTEFRKVNTASTLNLARQAAEAGVRRFVFISSIGVNGNQTLAPFTEMVTPKPQEPYALSKFEAEQGLKEIADQSEMEVTIIRPPLVYGPNAPGNFGSLMRWTKKGIPLPLGAIHNKRSLIGIDNLVDFIITCIDHPAAANQTFLVADGEDLSTTDLLRRVGQAMGKPARLIPVPMSVLKFGARLLGKQAMAQRLCGNLQVDISKARKLLGWEPLVSVDEGLRRAVRSNADSER